jgi:RNA polymerase sigma-70 factor (ECF subfamily)
MLVQVRLAGGAQPIEDESSRDVRGLVERARGGDAEAFRAIFNRYGRPVLAFIDHLLADRTRSEECLQETFVRAYRRLASMRDEELLESWLFGIARNVVREAIRAKYRTPPTIGLDEPASRALEASHSAADERLIGSELELHVRRALAALTADQRAVFVLKLFHAMSYRDISRITGASIGKLKTDLHRARLEMRRRLGPYLGAERKG